jgi:hypothetical protein
VAAGNVRLPPANCRRRIIERLRPDCATLANAGGGDAVTGDTSTPAADETGIDAIGRDAPVGKPAFGTAALRSPVRTRSAAGGSADFP